MTNICKLYKQIYVLGKYKGIDKKTGLELEKDGIKHFKYINQIKHYGGRNMKIYDFMRGQMKNIVYKLQYNKGKKLSLKTGK